MEGADWHPAAARISSAPAQATIHRQVIEDR
jgi:hypothetical protein